MIAQTKTTSVAPHGIGTNGRTMHNFGAGPSILPPEVFEEASKGLLSYQNTGLSILEIGHRTKTFQGVMDEAVHTLKELMQLDADHEVLFLHGGASTQFFQVPMNLLPQDSSAAFTDTGIWATKAIKEAKHFGEAQVVCSSNSANYSYLPKDFEVSGTPAYLHLTSNNTVYGTQWKDFDVFYKYKLPLVADMSSDILSRDIDFNKFDLIYAGAQKNIGAAGTTVVVVNKNILGRVSREIPTMLDYRKHIEAGSLLNTPPAFSIYVCMLTLRWLKKMGGVAEAERRSNEKSALLYNTLDALPVFTPTVAREDRSKMNAVFTIKDEAAEKEFLALCEKEGMVGVKGHRTTGGFRVSMYNALPIESVQALTQLMQFFASSKG